MFADGYGQGSCTQEALAACLNAGLMGLLGDPNPVVVMGENTSPGPALSSPGQVRSLAIRVERLGRIFSTRTPSRYRYSISPS